MDEEQKKAKMDEEQKKGSTEQKRVLHFSVVFTMKEKKGTLVPVMELCKKLDIKMTPIEFRPSLTNPAEEYDYYIKCESEGSSKEFLSSKERFLRSLKTIAVSVNVPWWPWFPCHIQDLDLRANDVKEGGKDLKADHPGFTDKEYRARREFFEKIAKDYKHGEKIPHVDYNEQEIDTWRTVFQELTKLYPTHACKEFTSVFPLLQKNCGYNEDQVPQLQEVSDFMKKRTGFQLRPVAGLLSPRDFLAGLAFRVFHSTQYIRHHSKPMYTPEPDVCHELLGHVPLFCDPSFAQFSQEIGLASLGAPDEYIEQLATLYWFTIEFGVCKQDGQKKAYGAGILSSFGELQYCLTDEPNVEPLDLSKAAHQEYPITKMQPLYFLAESFEDAKKKMMEFARTIPRPFSVRYNPYTQSVEVIKDKMSLKKVFNDIKHELDIVQDAAGRV